jgi:Fe-Mn family superoxide dismutase
MENKFYALPKLPYEYSALEPFISELQLTLHHQKHHQAYVNGANSILEQLEKSRREGTDLDIKSTLKSLSFNIGGHVLHSLFWNNLASVEKNGSPSATLNEVIENEFGRFDRFKKEFAQAATSVEGSGWAVLAFCRQTKRPIIMQIEKHNVNVYPMFRILMALDVWEHAYYLDYKNERSKFVDAFWNIVNWNEVNQRLEEVLNK